MPTIRGTIADLEKFKGNAEIEYGPAARDAAARLDGETQVLQAKGRRQQRNDGSKNKTEAAYARRLDDEQQRGNIAAWWWEPLKLRLADRTYYNIDFLVMLPDGLLEVHEVKGFMRDDAAVKLKVAASQFPIFTFRLVKRERGGWVVKVVSAG